MIGKLKGWDTVVVLDDLSTGSGDNLSALVGNPRFTFVEGSVLDEMLVRRLASECTVIVHLAAAVGVRNIPHNALGPSAPMSTEPKSCCAPWLR